MLGRRAVAAGAHSLVFTSARRPGSTGLACLFDWIPNHGPATAAEIAGSALMAEVPWLSVDCELLVLSACGERGNAHSGAFQDSAFRKTAVAWNAPPAPAPAKEVVARQHFPRCAGLKDILVVVTGNSWAVPNPGGHAGNDHTVPILDELARQIQPNASVSSIGPSGAPHGHGSTTAGRPKGRFQPGTLTPKRRGCPT